MSNYQKGSEWRKWDLQVQTILDDGYVSIEEYFDEIKKTFPEKIKKLVDIIGSEELIKKYDSRKYFYTDSQDDEKTRAKNYSKLFMNYLDIFHENIGAIGITDHNYDHDYLMDMLLLESERTTTKIIPGVEINVGGIHMLVFFGKKPYLKDTYSEGIKTFLSKLNIDAPKTNGSLTVSTKDCHDVIKTVIDDKVEGVIIYPHCNSDNGLFQERTRTDRTHLANIYNEQKTNILQTQNKVNAETLSKYIQGNNNLKSGYVFTLCSDSRCLNQILKSDDQGNNTWIKADPTFEGLKQILFESDARVKIQVMDPTYTYDKPHFQKIQIDNQLKVYNTVDSTLSFSKCSFDLNKNLVAIIGGRGTGKSTLIDYTASIFEGFKEKYIGNEKDQYNISHNDFHVYYAKNNEIEPTIEEYISNGINYLDYIYISQNYLKNKSKPEEVVDFVKKLLSLENNNFSQPLNQSIKENNTSISDIYDWFNEEDEEGDLINNRNWIQKFKEENEALLKNIETKENKIKLETYTKNIDKISGYESLLLELSGLTTDLLGIGDINDIIHEVNLSLSQITKYNKISKIDIKKQLKEIKDNEIIVKQEIKQLKESNKSIKQGFVDGGYRGDLETLLKDAENYQNNVKFSEQQIKEIDKQNIKLGKLLKVRSGFGKKIIDEYNKLKNNINQGWTNIFVDRSDNQREIIERLLLQNGTINIEGYISFNESKFYELLLQRLDKRMFKEDFLRQSMNITDIESWGDYINSGFNSFPIEQLDNILDIFFDISLRSQYIKVLANITYGGKPLNKLSVGQRGTALLCLQLATDAFAKPIIFDQPEDDLDNHFIMQNLVDIFKELKNYRQIIIVTHNANLVVNTDAEQIIVASNEEEILSYTMGSIEDLTIQEKICTILEGGKHAFEKRRLKYNFHS